MTDFARLLALLKNSAVEFIVVGGYAATAHGSAHVTVDLDIVYRRTDESISRLVATLEPLKPWVVVLLIPIFPLKEYRVRWINAEQYVGRRLRAQ